MFIASGGYGKVYDNKDGSVTKKIELISYEGKDSDPQIEYTTIREIVFLNTFNHPNICKKISQELIGSIPSTLNIKMTNSGLPLLKYSKKIDIKQRGYIIDHISFQVIKALYYFEINRIVHGDIKPSNILIDPDTENVTLIDFGGSLFDPSETNSFIWCSTKGFRPPEHMKKSKQKYIVNTKNDIFSFALTMFSFYFNTIPDEKYHPKNNHYNLLESFGKTIDDLCDIKDTKILRILYNCLSVENKNRPLASELYYMDYFKKYRKNDTFKYFPLKMDIPTFDNEENIEERDAIFKFMKKQANNLKMTKYYNHATMILDKITNNINLSNEGFNEDCYEYISLFCLHISYLLLDNSKNSREDIFYTYEDYNVYFVDIVNKILSKLNFDVYIKLY
jgi:serine/threonine protein kinase